jgi:hypothetical protein
LTFGDTFHEAPLSDSHHEDELILNVGHLTLGSQTVSADANQVEGRSSP